jgi:hypothetical protein
MTKISKKAVAAETKAEAVNTPAEPKTELVEAPKEQALEEPTSDIEFEEAPKEQGAPFEENVPAPEKEEAFSLEPKKDEVFSLEPTKGDGLPSLDEIKAKERALRKR